MIANKKAFKPKLLIVFLFVFNLLHPTILSSGLTGIDFYLGDKKTTLAIENVNDKPFLSLLDLQTLLGGRLDWIDLGVKIMWELKGNKFVFETGVPYLKYNDVTYQFADRPFLSGTTFYVPAQFVSRFLPYLFPESYNYDPGENIFYDVSVAASLKKLKYRVRRNATSLLLELNDSFSFSAGSPDTKNIEVIFRRAEITDEVAPLLMTLGYIDSVRVEQSGLLSKMLIYLNPMAKRYRIAETIEPAGVSISIFGDPLPIPQQDKPMTGEYEVVVKKETKIAAPSIEYGDREYPERTMKQEREKSNRNYSIDTIVIDAGHGGKDPGALSKDGLIEKDINLLIALELEKLFKEKSKLKVILTRRDDTFVPLQERTEIANNNQADLFLSIHCNAEKTGTLSGYETYFLSEAKTDEARAVALRENASLKYELGDSDTESLDSLLEDILADLAQNEFLRESSEWAEIIVEELDKKMKVRNRGVKQAGFYVLNGAFMPAILHETAFLTNKNEAKLLRDKRFRRKVAQGLYNAVEKYMERYQKKLSG